MTDDAEPPHDALAWQREYPLASYWKKRADEASKDAERYRWLRDPANNDNKAWSIVMTYESTGEQIDAAIDAAMGAEK